jgi:NitT/TauT family transport system substrate-binding protein
MMSRLLNSLVGGAVALVLPMVAAPPAHGADKVSIGIPGDGIGGAPMYVAIDQGYFKAEGLDLEVQQFKGGGITIAALIGDGVDVVTLQPSTGIWASVHGQNVKTFAAMFSEYTQNLVIRREIAEKHKITEDSPLKDRIAVLKGLTIGISVAGSAPDQLVRMLVRMGGMDPDRDVTITPVGSGPTKLAAYTNKLVDGFLHPSPLPEEAVLNHDGFPLITPSMGDVPQLKGFLGISLQSKGTWLKAHPELATKVASAIWKGERFLAEKPDAAREITYKHLKNIDRKVFDLAWKTNYPAFPKTPRVTRAAIEQNLLFMKGENGASLTDKLDVSSVFTNEYVDDAQKSMKAPQQ